MADSRACRHIDRLWQCESEGMRWVVDIPATTWSSLARVAEMTTEGLKDSCIAASHVSFHFIWRRFLDVASEYPWSLSRGDVKGNLVRLKFSECPEEPMSAQLWQLMQMNHNLDELVGAVGLLREVGWSSMPAEQQHESLAQLKR